MVFGDKSLRRGRPTGKNSAIRLRFGEQLHALAVVRSLLSEELVDHRGISPAERGVGRVNHSPRERTSKPAQIPQQPERNGDGHGGEETDHSQGDFDHEQEGVPQAIRRDCGRIFWGPTLRQDGRRTQIGRQAHQLGRQLCVQHRQLASSRVDRADPEVRQGTGFPQGARHASQLQWHRRQHSNPHLSGVDESGGRARPRGAAR